MSHATPTVVPRSSAKAFFWVIAGFIIFGFLVLLLPRMGTPVETNDQERAAKRIENLKKLHEQEKTLLTSSGWVNKEKGVAHIPLETAVELELPLLRAKQVRAAYPIVIAGAATTVPAATNAPAAVPASPAPKAKP